MADGNQMMIDQTVLVAKLNEIEAECEGDLARIIELLLLENHVLSLDQSTGFRRGIDMNFSEFPRFLEIQESGAPGTNEG